MKIRLVNYKKEFPNLGIGKVSFMSWFWFERYSSGKLIYVGVKHFAIHLDFRGDLFEELTGKKYDPRPRND